MNWKLAAVLLCTVAVRAQMLKTYRAGANGTARVAAAERAPYVPTTEIFASFNARLLKADQSHAGELSLVVDVTGENGEEATLVAPLSSTGEAYGEERSCSDEGMIYTAGLEEVNYVRFQMAKESHTYHVLLNRLLCRLLAAPFRCRGRGGSGEVALHTPYERWRITRVMVVLQAAAPAEMELGEVKVEQRLTPFDYARCAVVAPSNGFCCVQGKTTEWHCGGTPMGDGWHQVSGECFHRETGGSCSD